MYNCQKLIYTWLTWLNDRSMDRLIIVCCLLDNYVNWTLIFYISPHKLVIIRPVGKFCHNLIIVTAWGSIPANICWSWRRLQDMSWRCLEDISWRRLGGKQNVFLGIFVSNKSKSVSNKSIFYKFISDKSKANPKCVP